MQSSALLFSQGAKRYNKLHWYGNLSQLPCEINPHVWKLWRSMPIIITYITIILNQPNLACYSHSSSPNLQESTQGKKKDLRWFQKIWLVEILVVMINKISLLSVLKCSFIIGSLCTVCSLKAIWCMLTIEGAILDQNLSHERLTWCYNYPLKSSAQ